MNLKGALIYFSGTGNTEYIMKQFQKKLENKGIDSELIDTTVKDELKNEYDFYVFGAPIHAEMFPSYYIDWVRKNVSKDINKICAIFSTQAADKAAGIEELADVLKEKGMKIVVKDFIQMPNNYYVVMFKKDSRDKIEGLKKAAEIKVEELVESLINRKKHINKISKGRLFVGKISYKLFYRYSLRWAAKKLTVDEDICIKCRKCERECPTNNINLIDGKIVFYSQCISCQRCLHKCPVNAFRYKGKAFEQYYI